MKDLIRKIGIVAIIAMLGIIGYMITSHYFMQKNNNDNVKIQADYPYKTNNYLNYE